MTQHNREQNATLADKVAEFISKYKMILWATLAVLVVLVVVFTIVDNNIQGMNNMYSEKSEELQEDYQNWFNSSEEEKEQKESDLLNEIAEITDTEKNNILVEKALFIRGQVYLQKEEWDNAYGDFIRIAESSPDSYLASVSFYNAAGAKESSGDLQGALEILTGTADTYKANSPIIPEILFNMGRLNEALGNGKAAIESYDELTSSYSSSNWTNLAKTRIISLKASGVSQ